MNRTSTVEAGEDSQIVGNVPQFPGMIGTFMGRDALKLAVSALGLQKTDTAILPIYTCQDVLRAFVGNCNIAFYDVESDLTISPDHIRTVLKSNSQVKLVLITNYFGFLQPYRDQIRQICDSCDVCLIEDCAHSLLTQGSGSVGDFAVYSLRKILPLRDGGGLVPKASCSISSPNYHPRLYSDVLSSLAFLKSTLKVRSERFSRARVAAGAEKVPTVENRDAAILPLSAFAQRQLTNVCLDDVIKKRRSDFEFWDDFVRNTSHLTPLYNSLSADVCPFGYPIKVRNREQLELKARERGVNLRVHWRLDPGLGPECKSSHELSKQLLTLPLYPELGFRERSVIAELLTANR